MPEWFDDKVYIALAIVVFVVFRTPVRSYVHAALWNSINFVVSLFENGAASGAGRRTLGAAKNMPSSIKGIPPVVAAAIIIAVAIVASAFIYGYYTRQQACIGADYRNPYAPGQCK